MLTSDQPFFISDDVDPTPLTLTPAQAAQLSAITYHRAETTDDFMHILSGLNLMWIMVVSIFSFMMQVGYAFMASGAAHHKSASSILTNHLLAVTAGSMVFFAVSADLISKANGGLVGKDESDHALTALVATAADPSDVLLQDLGLKVIHLIRCLSCVLVAALQLQERTGTETYLILATTMAGITYPLTQSWIHGDGWLERLGFIDATSVSAMYMSGAFVGLVGNLMLGPRLALFRKSGKATVSTRSIRKLFPGAKAAPKETGGAQAAEDPAAADGTRPAGPAGRPGAATRGSAGQGAPASRGEQTGQARRDTPLPPPAAPPGATDVSSATMSFADQDSLEHRRRKESCDHLRGRMLLDDLRAAPAPPAAAGPGASQPVARGPSPRAPSSSAPARAAVPRAPPGAGASEAATSGDTLKEMQQTVKDKGPASVDGAAADFDSA